MRDPCPYESRGSLLTLSVLRCVKIQQEVGSLPPGRVFSPDTESAGVLILEFPEPPVYGILLEQPEWTKTGQIGSAASDMIAWGVS